nr:ATP-binding cassette domain-containing protein [Nanchangia anserum]
MTTITLESLTKDYPTRRAVDDVSFDIHGGEIFGFVGSNGAGKTTTMRMMLGVTAPTSGRVLLDGAPITAENRSQFGYMPEERGLYPKMHVHDQLVYLARLHGTDRDRAEANATMWEERLSISHYPRRHGRGPVTG